MIQLYDMSNDEPCGSLTEEQFQALVDALEEEGLEDEDYYINTETVEMLEASGADRDLIRTLRQALGDREEMDIRWERT
ncbi:MAG: galactosyldiacylglycerol synthase [Candidatus Rokuibacteriota bacterium]|nr:MAG: galactosyldiacylglycerol synthase [Candidatus Rokubacteria bacterium]